LVRRLSIEDGDAMKVLVIGNGGREHALTWKLAQSPRADRVFVAPGNAGTAEDGENVDIAVDDFPRLVQFAKQNDVGLTVVGPEAPLAAGAVDALSDAGLKVFGPKKAAASFTMPRAPSVSSTTGIRNRARTCRWS
jgi:phosphoribosylamine--glycine ligase